MQAEPKISAWSSQCCAIIVGLQPFTQAVDHVYVWPDGRMANTNRIHRLTACKDACEEATDVFGLSDPRLFPANEDGLMFAKMYAFRIGHELRHQAEQTCEQAISEPSA